MEPVQININVSLELGDKTVSVLQQLLNAAQAKPAPRRTTKTDPETKPAAQPETKPAPAPETKEAPAPAPAPAPETKAEPEEEKVISDEELREIVFAVRGAKPGNSVQIKNVIFPEFGIKTSIECPVERRAELVARLKELAA